MKIDGIRVLIVINLQNCEIGCVWKPGFVTYYIDRCTMYYKLPAV